ncbi:MAG: hypothetical protein JTJ13_07715, partial [Limosilactobacillus fermentum]|nr:hypothetical protein [Limosilactobacillus fermentum]
LLNKYPQRGDSSGVTTANRAGLTSVHPTNCSGTIFVYRRPRGFHQSHFSSWGLVSLLIPLTHYYLFLIIL